MPKTAKEFPCTINLSTTLEIKQSLVAMGYLQGDGGKYASAARNCMTRGFRAWLAGLSDRERKEFDEILERVKIMVVE